jgi:hypothetical protein
MASSQDDRTDSRSISIEADVREDEIDLRDYFRILWKRKYFIAIRSVLPAMIVGLVIFLWPRLYNVNYIYEVGLTGGEFTTLHNRFRSEENLDKIIARLEENGFSKYAQKMSDKASRMLLDELIHFEGFPPYLSATGPGERSFEEWQKIEATKCALLTMTIKGRPKKDMKKISSIIREDFENVIPLYPVERQLLDTVRNLKVEMAGIEKSKFALELELERKKAKLVKLTSVEVKGLEKISADVRLTFDDVNECDMYLPLPYQIQSTESRIINLEESIRRNQEMYDYNKDLLGLNEKIFSHLSSKIPSYYTIQQFHLFLTDAVNDYKDKQLIDYLNAYIRTIENTIAANTPFVKNPNVYMDLKGVVKKTLIAFAAFLIIAMVIAFVVEGGQKGKQQPLERLPNK